MFRYTILQNSLQLQCFVVYFIFIVTNNYLSNIKANLLPIIDDPVIILASPTSSNTPSITPTSTKSLSATSTASFRPSSSSSVTPTISVTSTPLSYTTVQSYYNAYSSCSENPSSSLPNRLGYGNSFIYSPNTDGTYNIGMISISEYRISWIIPTTIDNKISSSTSSSLSDISAELINSCSNVIQPENITYRSICFCPSSTIEVKPGIWKIYGASTQSGINTCLLIQRDFTISTGNSETNSIIDTAQIRIAYNLHNPMVCPEQDIFVSGAGIINEQDIAMVYIKELINIIPTNLNQPLPIVLLSSSIIFIISGIIE